MTWQVYRLTFELQSPLCIGDRYIGNLRKCKHYVPSITMWGAVTASLTRHLWDKLSGNANDKYKHVGENILRNSMRFGYFFLMEDKIVYYPHYEDNIGLCYGTGNKSAYEFEHDFIQTVGMTAIDAGTFSAQENTLHEMEFIGAFSKNHRKRLITGNVYIKKDSTKPEWLNLDDQASPLRKSLNTLWLGGSRSNGFGKVQLKADSINRNADEIVPGWSLDPDSQDLMFKLSNARSPLIAHCYLAESESINSFLGDFDVISGYVQKESNRSTKENNLVAVPGSILGFDGRYILDDNGVLIRAT